MFLDRTGYDVEIVIQSSSGEHDVDISGIVRKTRSQASRIFDAGGRKVIFQRGITHNDRPAIGVELSEPLVVVLYDDIGELFTLQVADYSAADATCAADNVMPIKLSHFLFPSPGIQ